MEMILTDEARAFVEEWNDGSPYVTANTSGSTGRPKEIKLLKKDMLLSAKATDRFFSIDASSLLLLPLSADYIAGKMQIVRAMEASCRLICETPSNRPFAGFTGRASMIPVVPSQLESLFESGLIARVDNIIIGGSPLPVRMEVRLLDAGVEAWVTYGMTETCSHVALRHVGNNVYHGLPGFTFSQDERGCLCVTSADMSFGSLQTNDVVKLISSDSFMWLGRADNVINSGGVKIHPEQLEGMIAEILKTHPEFYVASRTSDRWGEEAVVVTTASRDELPDSIIDDFADSAGRRLLKDIIRVSSIRRTSSGKIIRDRW